MIKVLILDDDYHEKKVVMLPEDGVLVKTTLVHFINISLCPPHKTEYRIKTAHYEDIANDCFVALFERLDGMASGVTCDENFASGFEKLYDSDEVVDGCDIY